MTHSDLLKIIGGFLGAAFSGGAVVALWKPLLDFFLNFGKEKAETKAVTITGEMSLNDGWQKFGREMRDEAQRVSLKLDGLEKKYDSLELLYANLQTEHESMKRENASLRQENANLRLEVGDLRHKVANYQATADMVAEVKKLEDSQAAEKVAFTDSQEAAMQTLKNNQ